MYTNQKKGYGKKGCNVVGCSARKGNQRRNTPRWDALAGRKRTRSGSKLPAANFRSGTKDG
jgi:hypothetical protein